MKSTPSSLAWPAATNCFVCPRTSWRIKATGGASNPAPSWRNKPTERVPNPAPSWRNQPTERAPASRRRFRQNETPRKIDASSKRCGEAPGEAPGAAAPSPHPRHLGDRLPVLARVGRTVVHPRLVVPHHRLAAADAFGEIAERLDLVAELDEACEDRVNSAPRLCSTKPPPSTAMPTPHSEKLLWMSDTMLPSRSTVERYVVSEPA
jgi:hypothetical protein